MLSRTPSSMPTTACQPCRVAVTRSSRTRVVAWDPGVSPRLVELITMPRWMIIDRRFFPVRAGARSSQISCRARGLSSTSSGATKDTNCTSSSFFQGAGATTSRITRPALMPPMNTSTAMQNSPGVPWTGSGALCTTWRGVPAVRAVTTVPGGRKPWSVTCTGRHALVGGATAGGSARSGKAPSVAPGGAPPSSCPMFTCNDSSNARMENLCLRKKAAAGPRSSASAMWCTPASLHRLYSSMVISRSIVSSTHPGWMLDCCATVSPHSRIASNKLLGSSEGVAVSSLSLTDSRSAVLSYSKLFCMSSTIELTICASWDVSCPGSTPTTGAAAASCALGLYFGESTR
mmetsp:Transcript_18812/g.35832  ORF Transcript_18812/g.35832 Transcript_18812/m.35832 type:complete len:346 (-) Transcript_18812:1556-2593(-)